MSFSWSPKDPDEEYEYTHDWSKRLLVDRGDGVPADVGDTILGPLEPDITKRPKLELDPASPVIPLGAIAQVGVSAVLQYFFPQGGNPGDKVKLIGTVWTAQGRRYQESFTLPIKQR
jgi:hypothetical protein